MAMLESQMPATLFQVQQRSFASLLHPACCAICALEPPGWQGADRVLSWLRRGSFLVFASPMRGLPERARTRPPVPAKASRRAPLLCWSCSSLLVRKPEAARALS